MIMIIGDSKVIVAGVGMMYFPIFSNQNIMDVNIYSSNRRFLLPSRFIIINPGVSDCCSTSNESLGKSSPIDLVVLFEDELKPLRPHQKFEQHQQKSHRLASLGDLAH